MYGRKILYRVLDDHGDPRTIPSLAHQLVQGDAIFAVFGADGTAGDVAVTQFLNASKVPDVAAGSGCGCRNAPGQLPDVFGWPLGDVREGKILGSYIARRYRGSKVAVFYAPDVTGRDELAGFRDTTRGEKLAVRAAGAASSAAVAAVRADRAQVVVMLTPAAAVTHLSTALGAARPRVPLVASGSGRAVGLPAGGDHRRVPAVGCGARNSLP